MGRSLFAQTAVRTLVAVGVVAVALLLWPKIWLALALAPAAGLWLAWSAARLASRDQPALQAAVHALAEGQEVHIQPSFRDHEPLAQTIAAAALEVRQDFAVSAERREKLEALLDSMQDAVTSVDAAGRIIWANKAMQRLVVDSFGSVRAGHSLVQTIRAPEVLACMQGALGNRQFAESGPALLAPGRLFTVTAAPMPEGGAVIVLRDMTRMEQVERGQREFVANVSHELRTPLTSIQGYVEMLLDSEDQGFADGEREEFLEAILKSARRMARLTDDLLALARVESGEQKLEPRPVRVQTLIRETTAALAGLVNERNGALRVAASVDAEVLADPDAVVQILSNLIANALNYGSTHVGSGHVGAWRGATGATIELTAERAAGAPEVTFGVRDFGEGIASEHLARIFERFYRVDKVRSRDSGGTGLGLAIVKQLVEAQRGRIWVESVLGRGSVFYFTLPVPAAPQPMDVLDAGPMPMAL